MKKLNFLLSISLLVSTSLFAQGTFTLKSSDIDWVMFDIPANENELVTNAGNLELGLAPDGAIQSMTNYGTQGFGGPCPPKGHGIHGYIITVYALKTESLGLDNTADPAIVGFNLWNNVIAKASIVAYYER